MLIRANESELSQIADLAKQIWYDHYIKIIGREQVDYMLKKMYAIDALNQQIREGQEFYFIQFNNKHLGFVSISNKGDGQWFIHKLYIQSSEQNKGLGSMVMNELWSTLLNKDTHTKLTIKLTVNRQNYTSINFYFKHGFKIEEVADFDIGDGYFMNDFIMVKTLNNE